MLTAGEIAHALGGKRTGQNSFVAKCPAHEDRTPSLSLTDTGDGLVLFHCHAGCSQAEVRDALVAKGLWPRVGDAGEAVHRVKSKPAPKPPSPDRGDQVQRLWREAVDPRGSLAERYLNGREFELDDDLAMRVMRFHARCPFGKDDADKSVFVPALVVAFRPFRDDDETRPPAAVHRIGLNPDGSKIGKLMLGKVAGCAVKLDADDMVEQGLGICEGIETGLAIRGTGWRPVWCLGSAVNIKSFAPIPGIEHLTIFADHDDTGLAAARECSQRWVDAGFEAVIHLRADDGKDFADA
ncbi:toprim domain-containing protein [Bradyrhizobium sp. AUGA SZCCT0177]|uniref:DUF7146 domain-containing protein n=1 Tax=Bradyrhizobium sp. AUGA SZCCT0177 TaxID=2807665 RepID=UPI001BA9A79A|nr:toprim domain-containing protein [Bradyrhizobium sp. AUGA SZCCT0177]MBR1286068.1 toprim domain-containing protein [Bradyrhizobium sp. AUGA SZCCT0177]